jgi:hypothetical protein
MDKPAIVLWWRSNRDFWDGAIGCVGCSELVKSECLVQQFAAHGTVSYTQRKPHRATLSGELMAVSCQFIQACSDKIGKMTSEYIYLNALAKVICKTVT